LCEHDALPNGVAGHTERRSLTQPEILTAWSNFGDLQIAEKLVRELAQEAGFSSFDHLPVKNPYHQIFAIRQAETCRATRIYHQQSAPR
jgi:hypothetical protein